MNTLPGLAPEPEPDSLEWMLHSPQVSDAQLIQVLLAEYYEKAYQLSLAKLSEPRLARQAACQALAQAVQQRSRYWGELTLEDWVLKYVQKTLASQKKPSRSSTKKLIWGNLGTPELQTPLEQAPNGENLEQAGAGFLQDQIEQELGKLRRRALRLSLMGKGILAGASLAVVVLLLDLAGINLVVPALKPFSRVRFYYPYVIQPGDTLNSIAKQAGVGVRDIVPNPGITPTMALDPGTTYWLPSLKPPWWQRLFPRRAEVPPPPLTLQSTPAEVKQRILDSSRYWQTLWADQLIILYGPPGYISPPYHVFRLQTWIHQPDQSLLLQGGNSNFSNSWLEAEYRDDNRLYVKYNPGSISTTKFLSASELASRTGYLISPYFLHFPNDNWLVRVVGMESVARRQTLVVDEYTAGGQRQGRLWVDRQLGVILASRQYGLADSGSDRQPVFEDQVLLSVKFNINIADSIFDPNSYFSNMAKDPSGTPLEQTGLIRSLPQLQYAPDPAGGNLAFDSPPPGFDPARSRLTLRLRSQPGDNPLDFPTQGNEDYETRRIDVYGDEFYLGTQTFQIAGQPRLTSCARSPDGSLVAFDLSGSSSPPVVYWFSLTDPHTLHTLPGKVNVPGKFAFSPSSRQMAFYGCNGDYFVWGCGLFLLNFDTGKVSTFIELETVYVIWIGWSPDGKYLAVVRFAQDSPYPDGQAYLELYRVSDGQVSYTGPFNVSTYQAAPDAPILGWGAAFQPQLAPLKGCALP